MKKIALLVILLVGIGRVLAHGYVVKTDPADNAELATSPQTIRIWFSEPLVTGSGEISMIQSNTGDEITLAETLHDTTDHTLISTELSQKLPDGAYIVTAKAKVQSDGHEPSSSFVFWVGAKNQAASGNVDETKPAYAVFGVLMGLLLVIMFIAFWVFKRNLLEVVRPTSETNHLSLK